MTGLSLCNELRPQSNQGWEPETPVLQNCLAWGLGVGPGLGQGGAGIEEF